MTLKKIILEKEYDNLIFTIFNEYLNLFIYNNTLNENTNLNKEINKREIASKCRYINDNGEGLLLISDLNAFKKFKDRKTFNILLAQVKSHKHQMGNKKNNECIKILAQKYNIYQKLIDKNYEQNNIEQPNCNLKIDKLIHNIQNTINELINDIITQFKNWNTFPIELPSYLKSDTAIRKLNIKERLNLIDPLLIETISILKLKKFIQQNNFNDVLINKFDNLFYLIETIECSAKNKQKISNYIISLRKLLKDARDEGLSDTLVQKYNTHISMLQDEYKLLLNQ